MLTLAEKQAEFKPMNFEKYLARLVSAAGELEMMDKDLALKSGLSYSTVHKIMEQKSKNMLVTTCYKLSVAIGVSADWLMGLRAANTKVEKHFDYQARTLRSWAKRKAA